MNNTGTEQQTPVAPATQFEHLEKYKALITSSNIGAWEYFTETDFLWCNDIYFSLLGRDIKDYDMSGRSNSNTTWIDLIHPEDKEEATARFEAFIQNPIGTHESYFRMKHREGNWIWIWSRGMLFKNVQKSSQNIIIGTHVDITRHKNNEEAI